MLMMISWWKQLIIKLLVAQDNVQVLEFSVDTAAILILPTTY